MNQRSGDITVGELADQTGYSRRHLSRMVQPTLGISLKQYIKLLRINRSLIEIEAEPELDLTRLAHQLRYYDQSHFIRDFKSVCEVSPGEYLRNMSHFYNETFKFSDTINNKTIAKKNEKK